MHHDVNNVRKRSVVRLAGGTWTRMWCSKGRTTVLEFGAFDVNNWARKHGDFCLRWFFFVSFVAALLCSVFWTALIIFAIATSRMSVEGLALVVPLVLFVWGAREMFRSFKGVRLGSTTKTDQLHVPDERSLSQEEVSLLEWLLGHGQPEASQYKMQIPKLRVVSRCGCGCPTIDFALGTVRKDGPSHIVAEAEGSSPEGIHVGVVVHVREDEISELEVFSTTGEQNVFSLPKPESLVPEQPEHEPRLIQTRRSAVIALILTGYLVAVTFRGFFSPSLHQSNWIFPLDFMLPTWARVGVDVAFYGYLLWLCVVFFRIAKGKEKALVAGWCPGVLLGPIKHLVSISAAAAIQQVQAASIAIAFVAVVFILLESPARNNARPDSHALV